MVERLVTPEIPIEVYVTTVTSNLEPCWGRKIQSHELSYIEQRSCYKHILLYACFTKKSL